MLTRLDLSPSLAGWSTSMYSARREVGVEGGLPEQGDERGLVRHHGPGERVLGHRMVGPEAAVVGHHQLEVLAEDEAPPELLVRVELGALGGEDVGLRVASRGSLVDGQVLEESL